MGLNSFQQFLTVHGLSFQFPVTQSLLIDYIAYMFEEGYSFSTIKSYISGIGCFLKFHNQMDVSQKFLIKKMLSGFARLDSKKDKRKPITFDILRDIIKAMQFICHSMYEATLFRAAFSLSYFGFLRAGELTSTNYNKGKIILRSHIQITQDKVYLVIPFSKTDQFGKSTTLTLNKHHQSDVCPVKLLSKYLFLRPKQDGPLFCHLNSNALTYYQFSSVLKQALSFSGFEPSLFNTHSLRIGAATQSHLDGTDIDLLKEQGRWHSNCYKTYIRPNLV